MLCFGVVVSVLMVSVLCTHGSSSECTCVNNSNDTYTFKLSSPGLNCIEKNWNSQATPLATMEKSDLTVILAKGDDFICARYWVPNVTFTGECIGSSGDRELFEVKCPEISSDCVHEKPSPGGPDHFAGFRNRWGLVAVAFFVLIIITLVVFIYKFG